METTGSLSDVLELRSKDLMILFPYANVQESVAALSTEDLCQMRFKVLKIIDDCRSLFKNSTPHVSAWFQHIDFLAYYGLACCIEYRRRGFKDSCAPAMMIRSHALYQLFNTVKVEQLPPFSAYPRSQDATLSLLNSKLSGHDRPFQSLELILKFDNSCRSTILLPPWFGSFKYHASHRSELIRRGYKNEMWSESNDIPYQWEVFPIEDQEAIRNAPYHHGR